MRKRRLLAVVLTAAMTASLLAGCGGKGDDKSSDGKGSSEQVLNIRNNSVVVGMNPILNTTAPDNAAYYMMCEPLARFRTAPDNTSEVVPGLAESWDTSEDGKVYTFHLRDGLKWSDGEPLTAQDFEYTLKLMADPVVAAANAWLFDGIIENFGEALYEKGKTPEDIGVKAVDEQTLEIKILHPASYFIELLSNLFPVRQDKYEEWGEKYGTAPDKTIYSGQFVVESWSQNTEMVLKKNTNYWNAEQVKLDGINYQVIQEEATAVQAFMNEELDVVSASDPNWGTQIEESGIAESYIVPNSAPEFLMFNCQNEYLKNTKVRQALSISFDRQKMVDDLRNGQSFPNMSMIPDTTNVGETAYTELVDGKNYFVEQMQKEHPDPKKLLEEGLTELGMEADASKVTLTYASRGTSELAKKVAEWFKQTWEESLGITVNIDMMEWNIMWDKIDVGEYDIASAGWGPYYNEPSGLLSLFEPENGNFNSEKTGWNDENSKKLKELLDQANNVTDEKEIAQLYLQAEELLVKNAIIAPEYQEGSPTYISNNVKGYYVSTVGNLDYSQISIEK